MSLLNDASLILVPSAIKTGEVLVQKPLPNKFADETGNYDGNDPQGSANLTFTRASNASRVNADGLVERVRTNYLLQSNTFDTTWGGSTTPTSGQSGYDGSSDAWLIQNVANGAWRSQSISPSGVNTISVYMKAGNVSWGRIAVSGGTIFSVYFDLSTGAIGSQSNTIDATIEDMGSGFYRCSVTFLANSNTLVLIYPASANNTLGLTGDNILIQNAQMEQGLVATDYLETTTSARSTFAGITVDGTSVPNVPRLDYSGGASCPSLLLEPQRTNALEYSEYFGASYWTKTGSSVVGGFTSPEGLSNAYELTEDTSTGTHEITRSITNVVSTSYSISVFAKANTRNWIRLSSADGGFVYFNLSTGEKGTETNATGKIVPFSNGWYRCQITFTASGINGSATIRIAESDGVTSYTGESKSVFLYGFQYETGSYSTSLISTQGSAVTRLADSAYGAGTSSTFNDSEGVLFVEMSSLQDGRLAVKNSDGSDQVIFGTTNGNVFYRIRENNINIFTEFSGVSGRVNRKIALKYKSADTSIFVDGVKYNLNTSTYTLAGLNEFLFTSEGNTTYGNIKQTTYFPTALTDAQCIELTTL